MASTFPRPATVQGYQVITSVCSETDVLRLVNGNLVKTVNVVRVPTVSFPLLFDLTYNAQSAVAGGNPVGNKWRHTWQMNLLFSGTPTSLVTFVDPSGRHYDFIPSGPDWVRSSTSYFFAGTLTESGGDWTITYPDGTVHTFDGSTGNLTSITDPSSNVTTLTYSSGQLMTIEEPTGRQIQLSYSGSWLTGITDPNSNVTTLVFDTGNALLTSIMGPEGCTTSYGYADPASSLITSRTDPNVNVVSYAYNEHGQLASVTDAETPSHTIRYEYGIISEWIGDFLETADLRRTTLIDAAGHPWEYRFDHAGMLWRAILPVDPANDIFHWRRYYWDANQKLLYTTGGYPHLSSRHGGPLLAGPRDSNSNLFRRGHTDPDLARPLMQASATGQLSQRTYNNARRVTSSNPGQAHYGVQGNWVGQFGNDGYVLCAFNDDASDLTSLPAYVTSVSQGSSSSSHQDEDSFFANLMDPRTLVSPTSLRRACGFWQDSSTFTVTVDLASAQSFNLSLYTASHDQPAFNVAPMLYNEQMGRDLTFTVTDMNGTQTCRVTNNAGGAWITFAVQGDAMHSITVEVAPSGANSDDARISALMFDPYDNHLTTHVYDGANNLTSTTNGLGETTSLSRNGDGTIDTLTDALSNPTQCTYGDTYKNLTTVQDADGHTVNMTYDLNGNMLTREDENSHTWTYTFDGKNRLLTTTDPESNVTTNDYDPAGNLIAITDANGNVTRRYYSGMNRLVKVVDALGDAHITEYDGSGNVVRTVDSRGQATLMEYDGCNRLVKTTRPDGSIVTQAYDTLNRLVATTSPNGNQDTLANVNLTGAGNLLANAGAEKPLPRAPYFAQWWDNVNAAGSRDTMVSHSGVASLVMSPGTVVRGNWYSQPSPGLQPGVRALSRFWTRPDGGTDTVTVQAGVKVRQLDATVVETMSSTVALPTGSTDWQLSPLFRIDVPGNAQFNGLPCDEYRVYNWTDGGTPQVWFDDFELYSVSTSMGYDGEGRLVRTQLPDGTVMRRVYDRFGRLARLIDSLGRISQMQYDSLGRLVATIDPLGDVTQRSYDAMGNLATITDPKGNVTSFDYTKLSRLQTITYPDSTAESFSYDYAGNLTGYTNNNGQSFTFQYDGANRLILKTYNTDSTTVGYSWDGVGNLTQRVERNGDVVDFFYDEANQLVRTVRTPAGGSINPGWVQNHAYDPNGNRTAFYNNGTPAVAIYNTSLYNDPSSLYGTLPVHWTAEYDSMNRLASYKDRNGNETDITYNVEGQAVAIQFPNGSPAVATTQTFDVVGRTMTASTVQDTTPILTLINGYDGNSNRVAVGTGADVWDYALDAVNRLVQEDLNRFVERSLDRFKLGTLDDTDITGDGVTLVAFADSFAGSLFNADRWRMAYTTLSKVGFEMRQDDGFRLVFPRGYSNVLLGFDINTPITPPIPYYGLYFNTAWGGAEQRIALSGDFDVQVSFADFQGRPQGNSQNVVLGLMVSDVSIETVLDDTSPNNTVQVVIDSLPEYASTIYNGGTPTTNTASTTDVAGKLRITRSGSTLTTYYYDNGMSSWVTLGTESSFTTSDLTASLYLQVTFAVGHGMFTDFTSATSSNTFGTAGTYTSTVYDAGQSVDWDTLTWDADLPAGATLQFQIAVSSSPEGPWSFVGPDGTSGTYFTSSGTAVHAGTSGQYARYQASLGGDGTVTPTLSRVDLTFAGSNTSAGYSYEFDAAGNMTKKVMEVQGGSTVTEVRDDPGWSAPDRINDLNQIMRNDITVGMTTTTWRYTYDSNGNMTGKTDGTNTWVYSWDEDNRLVQVTLPSSDTVTYTYDDLGRMLTRYLSTDMNPSTFVWDGMNMILETDPSGNVTRYYIPDGMLRSFERSGVVYQCHPDSIGSIRKVTDDTGLVVATFDFDAWGNPLPSTSDSIPNGFFYRYVGGLGVRYDADTGLYYMRARWADLGVQRFVGRDPKRASNLYVYAKNSPTVFVDPTGRRFAIWDPNAGMLWLFDADGSYSGWHLYTGTNDSKLPPGIYSLDNSANPSDNDFAIFPFPPNNPCKPVGTFKKSIGLQSAMDSDIELKQVIDAAGGPIRLVVAPGVAGAGGPDPNPPYPSQYDPDPNSPVTTPRPGAPVTPGYFGPPKNPLQIAFP